MVITDVSFIESLPFDLDSLADVEELYSISKQLEKTKIHQCDMQTARDCNFPRRRRSEAPPPDDVKGQSCKLVKANHKLTIKWS